VQPSDALEVPASHLDIAASHSGLHEDAGAVDDPGEDFRRQGRVGKAGSAFSYAMRRRRTDMLLTCFWRNL
jgi:hypothetical protein